MTDTNQPIQIRASYSQQEVPKINNNASETQHQHVVLSIIIFTPKTNSHVALKEAVFREK